MGSFSEAILCILAAVSIVAAGSIKDVEHIVLFMQESEYSLLKHQDTL